MACHAAALVGLANEAVPNCCEIHAEPVEFDHTWEERGIEDFASGVGVLPRLLTEASTTPCIW
jgi:hypothetical protein